MILQSIAPMSETTQFMYRLTWPLDREHCVLFIDAAISEMAMRKGAIVDIFTRKDDESEHESLKDEFVQNHSIFETTANKEFKYIAIILADEQTHTQLYIELCVDSDICDVQIMLFDDAGNIDTETDAEEYAPDMFMDAVEILTHVTYAVHHIDDEVAEAD